MTSGSDTHMSRRTVTQAACAWIGLNMAGGGRAGAASVSPRPNIVFIMADDMGYADAGCYGNPVIRTPAIDRLAAGGVMLTRAYANSAVCSATRTALMTGRYQDRLACGLEEPIATYDIGLPPGEPTWIRQLAAAGYWTALVGKWHLGGLPHYGPRKSGYRHFYGISGGAADYFTYQLIPGTDQFYQDEARIHDKGYLTTLLGNHTLSLIAARARDQQPFAISLHFNAPHWPWEGPQDEAESRRLAHASREASGGLADYDGGSLETYAAMVGAMDSQIGRVLDALEHHGMADNTIVVFTSDNGGERYADTYPFTGMKTELMEGGLRVPAIIRWPARLPPRREDEQVVVTMDWVPTLLAAAGTAMPADYPPDGQDLMAQMAGQAAAVPRNLFWRYHAQQQRAHLQGDYKYLEIRGNEYLFNVRHDPKERANLKHRDPERFERMRAQWLAWNRTMLPFTPGNYTGSPHGRYYVDHYGLEDDGLGAG
ncbi:sulfatase-like hydrolase/transferase [Komagataeibacter sp. FXV2]|nr:sulfatase-like hydrolase/transferase [Komagataeibacter sp. FXV2]